MRQTSILTAALAAAFAWSLTVGRYPVPLRTVAAVLASKVAPVPVTWTSTVATVVFDVRFPRAAAAVLVGAGLALAGAAYQTIFKNPMASPELLGVSAGAGFGAAAALLLGIGGAWVQGLAFAGGLAAVGIVLAVHRLAGGRSMVTLVLCGMVMAALFHALISIVEYVADPMDTLPAIAFWLMGSLAKTSNRDLACAAAPIGLGGAALYALRWRLGVTALSDDEAAALGVSVRKMRAVVMLCATLMTAATVSIGGIIGWVGLLVPHLARMLRGHDPDALLPTTALLGGGYLLLVDDVARSAASVEIPLGILTALLGAPFFIGLLAKTQRGGWA